MEVQDTSSRWWIVQNILYPAVNIAHDEINRQICQSIRLDVARNIQLTISVRLPPNFQLTAMAFVP